jgi:Protein of unknown function (DUF3618)
LKAPPNASLDETELEIARTRARLTDTADTLAAKLAPPRLVREGVEMLNEFFRRPDAVKLGAIRADPVALGLIGVGAAWLIAENLGLLGGVIPGRGEQTSSQTSSTSEPNVAEPAHEPIPTPALSAAEGDQSGGWFHQAVNATQGAFRSVYDRGGVVIGQASDLIVHPVDSGQKVREAIGGSPWLPGLVGLAAGAAVAMLLPASRPERKIAAQAREEMWETAEEIGHRAANAMREIAEDSKAD